MIKAAEDIFEEMIAAPDIPEDMPEEEAELIPESTDPKWVDFVISKLSDHELVKGAPTTDGLRRVTERYFGEILESDTEIIESKGSSINYAIIKHRLVIAKKSGSIISVSSCVDITKDKLPHPFNKHLIATGCTRAEGKALRRALKIRVHTFEELANSEEEENDGSNEFLNDQQKMGLKTMCTRMDVDLVKFVRGIADRKIKTIKHVSKKEASVMLEKLSYYSREVVPDELLGYQPDWVETF